MKIVIELKNDPPQYYNVTDETFATMDRDFRRCDGKYFYQLQPRGTAAVDWTKVTSIREIDEVSPNSFQRRVAQPKHEYMP